MMTYVYLIKFVYNNLKKIKMKGNYNVMNNPGNYNIFYYYLRSCINLAYFFLLLLFTSRGYQSVLSIYQINKLKIIYYITYVTNK